MPRTEMPCGDLDTISSFDAQNFTLRCFIFDANCQMYSRGNRFKKLSLSK